MATRADGDYMQAYRYTITTADPDSRFQYRVDVVTKADDREVGFGFTDTKWGARRRARAIARRHFHHPVPMVVDQGDLEVWDLGRPSSVTEIRRKS